MDSGRLNPRETGKYVVENSTENISISMVGVAKAAAMILKALRKGEMKNVDFDAHDMHPKTSDRAAVDWVFFMDTINFSFWSNEDSKFLVTYKGGKYTGYFGACACVNRAIDEGIPLTSADYMQNINANDVRNIFKADNGTVIPMVDERVKTISEAGRVINEKFDGSFYNAVIKCGKSAVKLLQLIINNFQSYRDFAEYKGQKISFLKRAQILVSDIYGCMRGKNDIGDFADIGEMTMFADYRVPQCLAYIGVLEYSPSLWELLKNGELIENGSEVEVELRAFSIKACDDIVQALKEMRHENDSHLRKLTAVDVDMFLWVYRRANAIDIENRVPFHRTRCIYY